MPYEIGGLADKFGNRYESRWLVELLIRLSREQILSVVHEGVGADGIDLQLCNNDGIKEFHQCKGRNADKDSWTLSVLESKNIFSYARKCLDSNAQHIYKFISPRSCDAMETLILRAKNSPDDPLEFYEHQIKAKKDIINPDIAKNFHTFQKYMELPSDDTPFAIARARDYLLRMEFVLLADTEYVKTQLTDRISDIFGSDPQSIYDIFANYTIESDRLRRTITISEINDYLAGRGIYKRDLSNNTQISPRIQELNREFEASFIPVGGSLINRLETETIYDFLQQNTSVILHGKAGSGKSGCVQELMIRLQQDSIPCLALKLDKRTPEKSAEHYGKDLSLPASPVLCLARIACGTTGVLILDQLDTVRWTAQHTKTALAVCKEMVAQAERHNSDTYFGGKVSILFVCRTFDVETDSGIQSLFASDSKAQNQTLWEKVTIGDLAEPDVIQVVGELYSQFTTKFKRLLKNSNNLYIWSKLDSERKKIEYASTYHLIHEYWKQFQQHCDAQGIPYFEILEMKNSLVSVMRNSSRMSVSRRALQGCSDMAIELAVSEGFIIKNDNTISFVHQSFYDAFVVETMANELSGGKKLVDLLGAKNIQTPPLRYQLQMLLQILAEDDQHTLAQSGGELLDSECVRHYMKYVFWEVVGQLTNIEYSLMTLVESRLVDPIWSSAVVESVIWGHPYYVEHFIDNGLIQKWLQNEKVDTALNLLQSVSTAIGDRIVDLLTPYAFQNSDMDVKIYHALNRKPENDTDNQFVFRLSLLTRNPQLWDNFIDFKALVQKDALRAARLLECNLVAYEPSSKERVGGIISSDPNPFEYLGKTIPETIWDMFMPIIKEKAIGGYSCWDPRMRVWSEVDVSPGLGRCVVRMAITAGKQLAEMHPEQYYTYFQRYADSKSMLINEILLYTMPMLPKQYADEILKWLISDSFFHLTEETGTYAKPLEAARLLIEKYSKPCSYAVFVRIEESLVSYQDRQHLRWAKDEIKANQEARKSGQPSSGRFGTNYPYWGRLQAYLLPALDERRTSSHTKQLVRVLQRRFEGYDLGGVKSGIVTSYNITSSIAHDISMKFSDKQWLTIIKNKKLESDEFQSRTHSRHTRFKSSHETFALQYTHAGQKNPERFVQLALRFPAAVDRHYLQAVWEIASTTEAPDNTGNWEPAKINTICKAIKKILLHHDADEYSICFGFSHLIRDRADEDWPEVVIERLIFLATDYNDPHLRDDDTDLEAASLNCVRGAATHALTALLWENSERYEQLKPVIDRLIQDEHAIVRQASLEAVIATYNIDCEQSARWFFKLINSDVRIARHYRTKKLFFCIWNQHKLECVDVIQRLFLSEDLESSEFGASIAANLFIIYNEGIEEFQELIFSGVLTEAQIKGCATVSMELMDKSQCHERSKMIIEELINYPALSVELLSRLFYRDCFVLPEDCELMKKVASLNPGETISSLNHYICKHDHPALDFIDIIAHICNQFTQSSEDIHNLYKNGYYTVIHHLPILVTKIYDQATDNETTINKCLDMWDALYQSNIGNTREITQQIMDK